MTSFYHTLFYYYQFYFFSFNVNIYFYRFNGFDALIGGFLCAIRNGKEDQLMCTTRTTTSTATSAVTSANGFAGDVSKTPTVASMTSTGTNTWSLKGTHFGTGKYSSEESEHRVMEAL